MSEKYKECLKESARHLQIADHMTYITFPLVNEKKLIIKIFEEIFKSVKNSVNSAIYFEFQNKNLILSNNEKEK
jgi:DNA integrity scanning protein DisA with diadenylate cyclase activity